MATALQTTTKKQKAQLPTLDSPANDPATVRATKNPETPAPAEPKAAPPELDTLNLVATFPTCLTCNRIFMDLDGLDGHLGLWPNHSVVKGTLGEEEEEDRLAAEALKRSQLAKRGQDAVRSQTCEVEDMRSQAAENFELELRIEAEMRRQELNMKTKALGKAARKAAEEDRKLEEEKEEEHDRKAMGRLMAEAFELQKATRKINQDPKVEVTHQPGPEEEDEAISPTETILTESIKRMEIKESRRKGDPIQAERDKWSPRVEDDRRTEVTKAETQVAVDNQMVLDEEQRNEEEMRKEALDQLASLRQAQATKRIAEHKKAQELEKSLAAKQRAKNKQLEDSLKLLQALAISDVDSDLASTPMVTTPEKKTANPPEPRQVGFQPVGPVHSTKSEFEDEAKAINNGKVGTISSSYNFHETVPLRKWPGVIKQTMDLNTIKARKFVPKKSELQISCEVEPRTTIALAETASELLAREAPLTDPEAVVRAMPPKEPTIPAMVASPNEVQFGLNSRWTKTGVAAEKKPDKSQAPGNLFTCWLCLNGGQVFRSDHALTNHIREEHSLKQCFNFAPVNPNYASQQQAATPPLLTQSTAKAAPETENNGSTVQTKTTMHADESRPIFNPAAAVFSPRRINRIQHPIRPAGGPWHPQQRFSFEFGSTAPTAAAADDLPTVPSSAARLPPPPPPPPLARPTPNQQQRNPPLHVPANAPAGTFLPYNRRSKEEAKPAGSQLNYSDLHTNQPNPKRIKVEAREEVIVSPAAVPSGLSTAVPAAVPTSLPAAVPASLPAALPAALPAIKQEPDSPLQHTTGHRDIFAKLLGLKETHWEEIHYMGNTWSALRDENRANELADILDPLCHTTDELSEAGFTLAPRSPEELKLMQKCYQCRSNSLQKPTESSDDTNVGIR